MRQAGAGAGARGEGGQAVPTNPPDGSKSPLPRRIDPQFGFGWPTAAAAVSAGPCAKPTTPVSTHARKKNACTNRSRNMSACKMNNT